MPRATFLITCVIGSIPGFNSDNDVTDAVRFNHCRD
jgi:hypothetical protein